eukprot:5916251-Amphidinium_carterae.1
MMRYLNPRQNRWLALERLNTFQKLKSPVLKGLHSLCVREFHTIRFQGGERLPLSDTRVSLHRDPIPPLTR